MRSTPEPVRQLSEPVLSALVLYTAETPEHANACRGIIAACCSQSLPVSDALVLSQLIGTRATQAGVLAEKLLADPDCPPTVAALAAELVGALAALAMVLGATKP